MMRSAEMRTRTRSTRRLLRAAALLGAVAAAGSASAELVTVEPDDFGRGAVLNDAFPGLTLYVSGRSTTGPELLTVEQGLGRASTGVLSFGYFRDRISRTGSEWRDDSVTQAFFHAEFDEPTAFVAIDVVRGGGPGDTADPGVLWAFDADGNLLETVRTLGGRSDFETLLVTREVADIASVRVTGAENPVGLDHFRYDAENGLPPPSCETRLQSCAQDLTLLQEECGDLQEELDQTAWELESCLAHNDELVALANDLLAENQRLQERVERQAERNARLRRALRRLLRRLGAVGDD